MQKTSMPDLLSSRRRLLSQCAVCGSQYGHHRHFARVPGMVFAAMYRIISKHPVPIVP